MTIATSEVSAKSAINGFSQKARDQVWQIVDLIVGKERADGTGPRQG
jgi:hypothetical protein